MPRIRSIKPEFCVSDQIVECSTNARLLFVLMWMFCDDRGIHPVSFSKLKAECFPADPFTTEEVRIWVNELIRARLIGRFSAQGLDFWQVTGWKHQKIDRPSFKFPEPESLSFDEYSTNDRGLLVGRHPPESKGVEGSRVEGSVVSPTAQPTLSPSEELSTAKPKTTTHASSTTGTRFTIPELPDEWRSFCVGERPDLDPVKTFDMFSDFWKARPGSAGVKLDWLMTWRNWVRKEKLSLPNGKNGHEPDWWRSDAGIERKGSEIGLRPNPGESMASFRDRVQSRVNEGRAA